MTMTTPPARSVQRTAAAALGAVAVVAALVVTALVGRRAGTEEAADGSPTLVREAWLMGTLLRAEVFGVERGAANRAVEAAFAEVERLERLLSTWEEGSAMGSVNRAPVGVPTAAPAELVGLLAAAESAAASTARAFEPAVGPLVDAWDLRGEGRRPTTAELSDALDAVAAGFAVDAPAGTVTRRHEEAWIDTGGFGKGAALGAAARALRDAGVGTALLDFGGQVLGLGDGRPGAPEGEGWRVGVLHPSLRDSVVVVLALLDVSAATSGPSERFVEVEGQRFSHILDPRTGTPAPAWGSVTVVGADPAEADALSTALYVLGPGAGAAWARGRDDVGVLFLEEHPDGVAARWNAAMEKWLRTLPGAIPAAGTER